MPKKKPNPRKKTAIAQPRWSDDPKRYMKLLRIASGLPAEEPGYFLPVTKHPPAPAPVDITDDRGPVLTASNLADRLDELSQTIEDEELTDKAGQSVAGRYLKEARDAGAFGDIPLLNEHLCGLPGPGMMLQKLEGLLWMGASPPIEGRRWKVDADLLRLKISSARSGGLDQPLEDGLQLVDILVFKGVAHKLPHRQWMVMDFMEDKDSVEVDELRDAVWGQEISDSTIRSTLSRLSTALLDIDMKVNFSLKQGTVKKESPSPL